MGLDLDAIDGQTPLDDDEKDGLLIPAISTRGELDEFEQENIERAILWTMGRSIKPGGIFTDPFVRLVHQRMFGDVWAWAGEFRNTDKNIGIDKWQISTALRGLLDDALYWQQHDIFSPDEMAIRVKHRLVSIHCFPNGNGRHSRLFADIIIEKIYQRPVFSWGAGKLPSKGDARARYLMALRAADQGDCQLLIEFARS